MDPKPAILEIRDQLDPLATEQNSGLTIAEAISAFLDGAALGSASLLIMAARRVRRTIDQEVVANRMALGPAVMDLRNLLSIGRLVAFGRRETNGDHEAIPRPLWSRLLPDEEANTATLPGGRHDPRRTYEDIRIFRPLIAPDTAERLNAVLLGDLWPHFVMMDPVVCRDLPHVKRELGAGLGSFEEGEMGAGAAFWPLALGASSLLDVWTGRYVSRLRGNPETGRLVGTPFPGTVDQAALNDRAMMGAEGPRHGEPFAADVARLHGRVVDLLRAGELVLAGPPSEGAPAAAIAFATMAAGDMRLDYRRGRVVQQAADGEWSAVRSAVVFALPMAETDGGCEPDDTPELSAPEWKVKMAAAIRSPVTIRAPVDPMKNPWEQALDALLRSRFEPSAPATKNELVEAVEAKLETLGSSNVADRAVWDRVEKYWPMLFRKLTGESSDGLPPEVKEKGRGGRKATHQWERAFDEVLSPHVAATAFDTLGGLAEAIEAAFDEIGAAAPPRDEINRHMREFWPILARRARPLV
ncbi:hypothetical protein EYW49_09080 [Siculibacillus lacustris]|uniref:Uncharacterized protein n=1 Tax=Siculibacillus lacustris TaxID=1549641 RepID=A0A4Q9VRA8_9HYPH|nr:hypothetical protein [Siculibacillus lacustris]TBW38414.1 hypothetical protein EYW49_09080 [Siculibacillus lacustris]